MGVALDTFTGLVIVEDEARAVVQGLRIRTAIVAVLVVATTIITAVAPSANLPRLFASFDVNLEQSAVWH